MITLQPQQDFVILWENSDPLDTTTYYPRVVIRDAISGTTLDTIDLSLVAGSTSLYRYTWQPPADVSGAGRQINMTVKVYDDSGHTSLAASKAIENRDYLIMDRLRHMGGGGGGVSVDYKKIGTIVADALAAQPKPEKQVHPVTDLAPVLKAIAGIEMPEIPEQKPVDLSSIQAALSAHTNSVLAAIKALPSPESIKPLVEKLEAMGADKLALDLKKAIGGIKEVFGGDLLEIKKLFSDVQEKLDAIPMFMGEITSGTKGEGKEKKKERNPADFV